MIQILKNMLIKKNKKNGDEYTPTIKTILPEDQLTFNEWAIYIYNETNRCYKSR